MHRIQLYSKKIRILKKISQKQHKTLEISKRLLMPQKNIPSSLIDLHIKTQRHKIAVFFDSLNANFCLIYFDSLILVTSTYGRN